jgi:hypothetical protein
MLLPDPATREFFSCLLECQIMNDVSDSVLIKNCFESIRAELTVKILSRTRQIFRYKYAHEFSFNPSNEEVKLYVRQPLLQSKEPSWTVLHGSD